MVFYKGGFQCLEMENTHRWWLMKSYNKEFKNKYITSILQKI